MIPSTAACTSWAGASSRRAGDRRGRSQRRRSTRDGTPVPAASTSPGASSTSSPSTSRRRSSNQARARSGASAFTGLSPIRPPITETCRGPDIQARARTVHRSATGLASQASYASVGSQPASRSSVMPWSSRPAAEAVSTTSAATSGSTWSRVAVARRSRTPRPPAFSAPGGWVPQRSSSSSVRRTSSKAAPAAARSTSDCSRSEVASGDGLSIPSGRRARRTDQGKVTWRSSRRASRPWATRDAVAPGPPFQRPSTPERSSFASTARSWSPRPARSRSTSSVGGPGGTRSSSPTTTTGRSGSPHTSASVRRRSSAACTDAGAAGSPIGGSPWTSECRTSSSRVSSWSRARRTDARTTTRAASCPESWGAGAARSGRASSSAASRSSGQPRSWSASVRGPVADPSTSLRTDIRPILRGLC